MRLERDALAAELAAVRGQVAERAAELAGIELAHDGDGCTPDQWMHDVSSGLPLERSEMLARRVLIHAFRGSQAMCHIAIREVFATWSDDRRPLAGRALVAASLGRLAELNQRTRNLLERAGVLTVGQLLALEAVLWRLNLDSCGPVMIRALERLCGQLRARAGGALLPEPPDVPLKPLGEGPQSKVQSPKLRVQGSRENPGKEKFNPDWQREDPAAAARGRARSFNRQFRVGAAVVYLADFSRGQGRPAELLQEAHVARDGRVVCHLELAGGAVEVVPIEHVAGRG
jgi:hypothetical protein